MAASAPVAPRAKTVLLTGAAGGLGAPSTLELLRSGLRVIALDRDAPRLDALREQASAQGLRGLSVLEADLADAAALRGKLEGASARGVDVVVNNAAIYPSKPFEEYTLDEHVAVQRVNVDAAIACVQFALPHMRRQGWGRIVNITSVTLYGGWANLSPYVQSKGALLGLTRAWAREFGPYGVTVNAISPGAFPTDAEKIHPEPEKYAQFVLEHQAVKRRGRPGDIANALLFLIGEESGFITGQTLNVDGGWVMR